MLSYKAYKASDIIVLIIFGFGVEMLGTILVSKRLMQGMPYTVAGLLFTILAVVRWRKLGLVTIPFYVLANFLAGHFFGGETPVEQTMVRAEYDIYHVIVGFISYFAVLFILALFKHRNRRGFVNIKDVIKSVSAVLILYIVALGCLRPMFKAIQGRGLDLNEYWLCWQTVIIYQAIAAIATIVLACILYKQNTLIDVKDSFLSKKREREYEREYYTQLSKEIKEAEQEEASIGKESEHYGNDQR